MKANTALQGLPITIGYRVSGISHFTAFAVLMPRCDQEMPYSSLHAHDPNEPLPYTVETLYD